MSETAMSARDKICAILLCELYFIFLQMFQGMKLQFLTTCPSNKHLKHFMPLRSLGARPTTIQRNPFNQSQLEREALLLEEKLKQQLTKVDQQPPVAHGQSNTGRLLPHQV